MIAYDQLTEGSWSARWGDHVIHVAYVHNEWRATVWRWTRGGGLTERTQLDRCDGLPSSRVAVQWACGVLAELGAIVLIDGEKRNLATVLMFDSAPTLTR